MDLELAKDLSRPALLRHIIFNPDANDFVYAILGHQGKDYKVNWFRDISVSKPEWNASFEEVSR